MKFEKFTRRPYDVNAVQVTPENANEVADWCGGTVVLGDYKHSKFMIKLPIVKVPGNGVNKGKLVDARIGSWIIEYKGNFRVYREKQIHEDFYQNHGSDRAKFEPGDLVRELDQNDGLKEGVVKMVNQVCVDYGMLGNYLHEPAELVKIEEYSEQTVKRLAEEKRRQDPIQALRDEAEAAVMQGDLFVHEQLTEAFEESQIIENIGDIKIGTDVVVSDQMNDFFSKVGTVESFVNDNCIAVKMEMQHGQKKAEIVNHLVREVQICDQVKWVLVHSDVSPQQGWVGWVVQAGSVGEAVTVAFRPANFMDGARDKCFSYMHYELEELDSQPQPIPVYEI